MQVEPLLTKIITVLIGAKFTGPLSIFNGNVVLTRRLERVIGMRVKFFSVSSGPGEYAIANGYVRLVKSNELSSHFRDNYFQVAQTLNNNQMVGTAVSNVIGYFAPSVSENNLASQYDQSSTTMIMFAKEETIDAFDWSVEGLNGTLVTAAPYSVEMAIEFMQNPVY